MLAALLESIVFHVLSSPRNAETIFLPFYRHRAAREQYLCRFIVVARRGNNIFAVLSSPRSAETISLPFYRHRAARKQYFCISVLAALLRALKFLFSSLRNGDMCWNGRGGACVPARVTLQGRIHHPFPAHNVCIFGMETPLRGRSGGHTGTAPTVSFGWIACGWFCLFVGW